MAKLKENLLPTVFVIFGATGDLMQKKLIPALFHLQAKNLLPQLFQITGFARKALSKEEFQEFVSSFLPQNTGNKQERVKFLSFLSYQQGLFEERKGYANLAQFLGMRDKEWQVCSNKLFYLAVPPVYYKTILMHLAGSGLTLPCSPAEGWTRVIVEKPFGKDLKTAKELDALLGKLFKEEQVYRMDHYLGKDTVENILAFRFSNSFLQDSWNTKGIEHIHIRLFEKEGVAERGKFYEGIGALRDVGQNHLLQMLALFTMDNPGKFDAASIRRKRAEILKSLPVLSLSEIRKKTSRAQYEEYRKEPHVPADSQIETYFRIETFLKHPSWKGVSVLLESGKGMKKDEVEVVITFRHASPCLCPPEAHLKNVLSYRIQPNEGITVSFGVKKPGSGMVIEEKNLSFDFKQAYAKEEFVDAYEKLLLSCIKGDQTLFVSTEEIMASWKFIDPIIRAWEKNAVPLEKYA